LAKKRTTVLEANGVPMAGKVGVGNFDGAIEALHYILSCGAGEDFGRSEN